MGTGGRRCVGGRRGWEKVGEGGRGWEKVREGVRRWEGVCRRWEKAGERGGRVCRGW